MKIMMGSTISLILGTGVGGFEFAVPDLFSLSYAEAKVVMENSGLNTGALIVDPDVRDTAAAFVYRQSPQRFNDDRKFNRIRQGQTIDVWLSVMKPVRDSAIVQPPAVEQ
jgi:eukaryotic-like serine/threonine-protein kinase